MHKQRFCYVKPNQRRWIVPGNRNKQWRNEFKVEKNNEDCPKFGYKMQLYNVAAHTERGIDLPKVVHEKHQTGKGWRHSGVWLTSWASYFLLKMTAEAMKCLCDLPKVESQSYKATGHKALAAELSRLVRPLKDVILNVIIIENCPTSVMKSPRLWGNMALVSSL